MSRYRRSFLAVGALVALGSLAVAPVASAHARVSEQSRHSRPAGPHQLTLSTVVTGLDSPKHLIVGPHGSLYVAEGGTGGTTSDPSAFGIGVTGAPTVFYVGTTGSIARIDQGRAVPVLAGMQSAIEQDNAEVSGPASVLFHRGHLVVAMQDNLVQPDGSTALPGDEFGKIISARPGSAPSTWRPLADLAAFAAAHPQPGDVTTAPIPETPYNSDPYDIVAYRGGYAVADAGANSVLWLSPTGRISLLAWLPTTADGQAVPDSLAVGPDGALYIGELRGVPSTPGTADVYRIVPGQTPTVYASGFSAITDLAFDHLGRLLVLEYSTGGLLDMTDPGAVIRVSKSGNQETDTVLASAGLADPTGLAVGPDGTIYIVNHGIATGTQTPSGEILALK